MFHMVVPTFLCFTTYLTKKGGTGPERFWRNRCTCKLRAMKQEETWCSPVLYSIEKRDKEDRTRSSHWMQTHVSSNSFSDSSKWLSTRSSVFSLDRANPEHSSSPLAEAEKHRSWSAVNSPVLSPVQTSFGCMELCSVMSTFALRFKMHLYSDRHRGIAFSHFICHLFSLMWALKCYPLCVLSRHLCLHLFPFCTPTFAFSSFIGHCRFGLRTVQPACPKFSFPTGKLKCYLWL